MRQTMRAESRPRRKKGGAAAARRRIQARKPARRDEAGHVASPTAVAAELLRTGVAPNQLPRRRNEISREDDTMRVGDPDDSGMLNEYVGEDTPGGSTPTPDQNGVDEIGRVYGLQEEDSGALRSSAEVLARRDRHRSELRAPRRPQP